MKPVRKMFCILSLCTLISGQSLLAQWIQQPFPATEDLRKVFFVDSTTGWVIGDRHLWHTTDSGVTWTAQDTVYGGGGTAFYALNRETALFADWGSTTGVRGIRRTTNGGTTWVTVDNSAYLTCYDFRFVNPRVGYAAGGSLSVSPPGYLPQGVIRKSIDGGLSWSVISSVPLPSGVYGDSGNDFWALSFVDSLHGWAITGNTNLIFQTSDGGNHWAFQDTVGHTEIGLAPLADVQFTSIDSGWVVGGLRGHSVIERTTDGGKTWSWSSYTAGNVSSLREICMISSQIGWIVGYAYEFTPKRTTDGGATWMNQATSPGYISFQSISMLNVNLGWAVGLAGKVYKTTNGGVLVSVAEHQSGVPEVYFLEQNYPNPFNIASTITYQIRETAHVSLKVIDLLGREVAVLVDRVEEPGYKTVGFDGARVSSGIYYYRLIAGDFTQTRKLILLK